MKLCSSSFTDSCFPLFFPASKCGKATQIFINMIVIPGVFIALGALGIFSWPVALIAAGSFILLELFLLTLNGSGCVERPTNWYHEQYKDPATTHRLFQENPNKVINDTAKHMQETFGNEVVQNASTGAENLQVQRAAADAFE